MSHHLLSTLRVVVLLGLYLAGAALSLHLIHAPGEVALFWPASGLAFAVVLRYGLRWWWFVPVGNLLMHGLLDPVAWNFLPFSVFSNALGVIAGAWLVQRHANMPRLSVAYGLSILEGGLLLAAISGLIGAVGLYVAGLSNLLQMPVNFLRWALGDALSVAAITPIALQLLMRERARSPVLRNDDYGALRERVIWSLLMLAALIAVITGARIESPFILGLTAVPLALLLWSAMRFPPIWTAAGVALMVFVMTIAIASNVGSFVQPTHLRDIVILLVFLSLLAIAPLLLALGNHERRLAQRSLLRRALTDTLTGLPNRTAFEDALRTQIDRMQQQPGHSGAGQCALVYFDLDHFTLINDTASHQAGDALIKGVASLIRAQLPASDAVFRIGGDEFAALLDDCDESGARTRVQGVLSILERYRLAWHGLVLNTSASAGIAMFGVQAGGYSSLLAQADAACFTAKEMGGNRLCVASTGPGEMRSRTEAMRWAVRIRTGLDDDQFELYCQDIVSSTALVQRGRHFETLLRLNPGGPLLMPGDFIPAAERFRLGVQIDRHVVAMVLRWFDNHPDALADVDTCAINLTAGSLMNEDFARFVDSQLRGSRMVPEQLCFEITETSAVHDLARARAFIQQMRALGCRFALDDFGTGFSSFAYLRSLDVDYIKIDGSFVRDLEGSPMSGSVVRSITDIAHVLNKRTIAEHAETESICATLRAMGVDYLQGHALHRPEPIGQYFAYEPRTGQRASV
ncbi:MAG: EAL domain-containing protein [Xanthomonadaceae bacterium]|nr:EAL domain-containing protein [Xanthomonadaceae bacterium]MDP2184809.1 EAL domain-containing protein [Xanthomonadales bacterium]MDZ4116033.1 EAL domain-containing protein [Xanthomonadaceae bacterium]MDZ4378411.1 EAL domain-containing protein [Xanthomonadaceae bacterium]